MTFRRGRDEVQCNQCGAVQFEDVAVGWLEVRGIGVLSFGNYFADDRHYCGQACLSDALAVRLLAQKDKL